MSRINDTFWFLCTPFVYFALTNMPLFTFHSAFVLLLFLLIFVLFSSIFINMLCFGIFREKSQRVYRLGLRTTLVMVLAITCWVLDKFFCDTYLGQKFPYLHAIWHVLIFISSYTACVLFAYYAVKEEHVNHIPDLRYWPVNDFELGIPFVSIKCYYSEEKRNI